MSARAVADVVHTAPAQTRLEEVLRIGASLRVSDEPLRLTYHEDGEVDETGVLFGGARMYTHAFKFVNAERLLIKTNENDKVKTAFFEKQANDAWKSLLKVAEMRKNIEKITEQMLKPEYRRRVFEKHKTAQSDRSIQMANSIVKSLTYGKPLKILYKNSAKREMNDSDEEDEE